MFMGYPLRVETDDPHVQAKFVAWVRNNVGPQAPSASLKTLLRDVEDYLDGCVFQGWRWRKLRAATMVARCDVEAAESSHRMWREIA